MNEVQLGTLTTIHTATTLEFDDFGYQNEELPPFLAPVALRHRNMDPAPIGHPVDVISSFCPIVWQHFA
jgi:hypothetical protein